MTSIPLRAADANVWPRSAASTATGASTTGPIPIGGFGATAAGLPTVNNSNLPLSTLPNTSSFGPPAPQPPPFTPFPSIRQPLTPFPSLQQQQPNAPFPSMRQPLTTTTSIGTNPYATAQSLPPLPPFNSPPANLGPNPAQLLQNEANHRRLMQLEDENAQRRSTTLTLQQLGTQLLQGQMDVQEQVLQYQFMLEQCMETLDHQNFVLNGQAEELALLRAKMKHFDYLMDAIRHSKENEQHHQRNTSNDTNMVDNNALCSRRLLSLYAPAGSPFFPGGVTRVTSSKFQPFNPRYRSPTGRSSKPNEPQNNTPANPNPAPANNRLSRPVSNTNN